MKALTATETREAERVIAQRYGVSTGRLMESAGQAISSVVENFHAGRFRTSGTLEPEPDVRVAVLCGRGSNGGDGFVAARSLRKLAWKMVVRLYLFGTQQDLKSDAAENCRLWREAGGAIVEITDDVSWQSAWKEIEWADIVIDALLGTGLRGSATGLIASAIEALNRHSRNATAPLPSLIVAADIPSGLPSDGEAAQGPVLRAHKTVTFVAPKVGQLISADAACCGELLVRLIGSPPELADEVGKGPIRWAGPHEFAALPLIRRPDSHKGTFGHTLIVAGSLGKSGAAILAGQASLHAGAGLTTIATPDAVLPIVAAAHPEYMTEPLASTETGTAKGASDNSVQIAELLQGKTVLAIGPGLGTHPDTQQFIRDLVASAELPIVLDADGLNAFAARSDLLKARKSPFLAITPHPGEMARLLGIKATDVEADRVNTALEAARRWDVHVILKGSRTILAFSDGQVWVNTIGSPSLAKGGSGDVLTGVLAALTAQFGTQGWLRVLALGVYLHGAASRGSLGFEDESGPVAGDLARGISMARRNLLQEIRRRG